MPSSGAVKFPEAVFIAPPTFSTSTSKGMTALFNPKALIRWTEK